MVNKPLSHVIWTDAHSTLDELTLDEIKARHKPSIIHTYGYVVLSDERGIWIVQEWLPADRDDSLDTFRGHSFIPRGMVLSETTLKLSKKRKASGNTKQRRSDQAPQVVSSGDSDNQERNPARGVPTP